jgi:hypothetical protein
LTWISEQVTLRSSSGWPVARRATGYEPASFALVFTLEAMLFIAAAAIGAFVSGRRATLSPISGLRAEPAE